MSDLILDEFRGFSEEELKDELKAETLMMFAFAAPEAYYPEGTSASRGYFGREEKIDSERKLSLFWSKLLMISRQLFETLRPGT
jgi:hypothetical protein